MKQKTSPNPKGIIVRRKDGSFFACYAPNAIGRSAAELLDKAKKEADQIGGTVEVLG